MVLPLTSIAMSFLPPGSKPGLHGVVLRYEVHEPPVVHQANAVHHPVLHASRLDVGLERVDRHALQSLLHLLRDGRVPGRRVYAVLDQQHRGSLPGELQAGLQGPVLERRLVDGMQHGSGPQTLRITSWASMISAMRCALTTSTGTTRSAALRPRACSASSST